MSSLRFIVFGLGQTGEIACKMLIDSGATIVAAYSRTRHVGKDVGTVVGRPATGVLVQPVDVFVARPGSADVALFFTSSLISDLLGDAARCLEAGVRVLTITEDASYPWLHAPEIAGRLDAIAKAAGSCLISTGMNDVPMVQMPLSVTAMSRDILRIRSVSVGNFGRLGAATLDHMGVGASQEAFEAMLVSTDSSEGLTTAPISLTVAQAIAARMGVQIIQSELAVSAIVSDKDVRIPALERIIPAGWVVGIREVAVLTTSGPSIEVELEGKIFDADDEEVCSTIVEGFPSFALELKPIWTEHHPVKGEILPGFSEATVAICLNRVADLLRAPPGLCSVDRLPAARYLPRMEA